MRVIELDKYIDHDWSTDSNFTAIMNTAMNRKFQQQGQVNINPNSNDSIEMICMSRVLNNINEYKNNNDKRTYKHRALQGLLNKVDRTYHLQVVADYNFCNQVHSHHRTLLDLPVVF